MGHRVGFSVRVAAVALTTVLLGASCGGGRPRAARSTPTGTQAPPTTLAPPTTTTTSSTTTTSTTTTTTTMPCFVCPPQDSAGFPLGFMTGSSDQLGCFYPNEQHACLYGNGGLIVDGDGGSCPPNAVNTCS